MVKRYEVRVREGVSLPLVQAAGRRFPKCEATVVREGNPGLAEMRANELLEVVEIGPQVQRDAEISPLPGLEEADDETE